MITIEILTMPYMIPFCGPRLLDLVSYNPMVIDITKNAVPFSIQWVALIPEDIVEIIQITTDIRPSKSKVPGFEPHRAGCIRFYS
jgi:hypothetical protein